MSQSSWIQRKCLVCVAVIAFAPVTIADDKSGRQPEQAIEAKVSRLLEELDDLQQQRKSGQDEWAGKMRELIELGSDAVPELCRALRDTPISDRRMLRSLPFILRGIGDRRAIPTLIETLPKCYGNDGSDMGYHSNDEQLLAFMRKHDDDLEDRDPEGYNWGRPINEVRTALNKLSGTSHGEIELCFVSSRGGTERQKLLKQMLYDRCADRWAHWWEENWQHHVDDQAYAKVNLKPTASPEDVLPEFKRDIDLQVARRTSNLICQPLSIKNGGRVFHDIDTGRKGGLHRALRKKNTRQNEQAMIKWAISEGYDLMGNTVDVDGETVFVLQALGAQAWEVPPDHWEKYQQMSADKIIESGRPVDKLLVARDAVSNQPDYKGTGIFFLITREETPVLLRLGVEVHDTNIKRGRIEKDRELNPTGLFKGRRYALRILAEREPRQR